MKHKKPYKRCMFNQKKPIIRFPNFNQSFKFLQRFTVFNILRYYGPYFASWKFDRLDTIVCCFYIFSPELASLTTEIILWFLKVKYLLHYFR